jgi:hypothetical protein
MLLCRLGHASNFVAELSAQIINVIGATAPSDKVRSRGMRTGLSAKPADNLSSAKACAAFQ